MDKTEEIKRALRGLSYQSETDAPLELVEEYQEIDFEKFFDPLIKSQDWHGQEEKEITEKFSALKKLLKVHCEQIAVVKLGKKESEIHIVGRDEDYKLIWIKTRSVET